MNTQIYEEACIWFIDFRAADIDAAARKRFDAWIRKSPEHLRAYLEITEIWQDAALTGVSDGSSADELIAAAKRTEQNVFPLSDQRLALTQSLTSAQSEARARRGISRRSAGAFALAASVLIALLGTWHYSERGTYSTAVGERRSITLPDGSTIELNARSQIKVRYTNSERKVELLEGQALFDVAKDISRAFVVRSDDAQVRAVGTQFDVYRKMNGTVVTVVEGRVAVLPRAADFTESALDPTLLNELSHALTPLPGEILLAAGEQVTVSPKATPRVEKDKATSAIAWTQHQLVFKSSPLPDVIEEFNRYNNRQLVIEGDDLADFHISGVYSSTDPSLLVRFLRDQPHIHIRETDDAVVISRTR